MADYGKIDMAITYSENSDYSSPSISKAIQATFASPTKFQYVKLNAAACELADFTTIGYVIAYNRSTTTSATLTYNTTAGAVTQVLGAGKVTVLTDVLAANDFTSAGAADVEVWVTGV